MIRKINEALSMDELFDSIRRNAEAIITDIDEIEGKDCKLDNDGMSLLKKAQKEIIGVRSRMSGVRTSCSAMYGRKENYCVKGNKRRSIKEGYTSYLYQIVDSETGEIIDVLRDEETAEIFAKEYIRKWATDDDPVSIDCYMIVADEDSGRWDEDDDGQYMWTLDSLNGMMQFN